jgi:hypothetical protein
LKLQKRFMFKTINLLTPNEVARRLDYSEGFIGRLIATNLLLPYGRLENREAVFAESDLERIACVIDGYLQSEGGAWDRWTEQQNKLARTGETWHRVVYDQEGRRIR